MKVNKSKIARQFKKYLATAGGNGMMKRKKHCQKNKKKLMRWTTNAKSLKVDFLQSEKRHPNAPEIH
jgi:hypothetical protein